MELLPPATIEVAYRESGEIIWSLGELLPDGVYLGLPESIYFAQKRLGSTDLKTLCKTPADYWWGSEFNPNKEDKKWVMANDRDYGRAFHYLLLEGEAAYRERAKITPWPNFTSGDAKKWRDECFLEGITILNEEMDRNIRLMCALVENHPEMGEAMAEGLSEVSVFWTDEQGHRFRARFDKLLPAHVVDPKSFGAHKRGRDDRDRALRIVAELSYDVQRYQYDVARYLLPAFVEAGRVYGGTEEQRAWLGRFPQADRERLEERMEFYPNGHPDQQSAWSWLWLFMQKPSDSKGNAPIVMPIERPRHDLTWRTGKMKMETALANFDHYVRTFGLGDQPNAAGQPSVPWASINRVWRPLDTEFPTWLGDVNAAELLSTDEEDEPE